MQYKSVVFVLICCFFFTGKSNCTTNKTINYKQKIQSNSKRNSIKHKFNKLLDKKYVLPILYASLSVGSGALGYFSSLKLWNPETRKFVINSSKISATGYTLLGYSIASLSVAGFVASIIS